MADAQHPYGPPNVLTAAAVFQLAVDAGFSARPPAVHGPAPPSGNYSDASIATAIASAESGLDASIVNVQSGATGLWQIVPGRSSLINPQANAAAAHSKFLTQGWNAWSTYQSGTYKNFLGSVTSKPGAVQSQGTIANPVSATLHGIEAIGGFFAKLTQGSTWLRILFVLGGIALLAWGLYALANETKVGRSAIGKAKSAAKLAAVA